MAKSKANPLTECLNAVNFKVPYKYDKKSVGAWVLTLFVSEGQDIYHHANEMSKIMFSVPDEVVFKYYVKAIPRKQRYLRFTKKTKESKEKEKAAQILMDQYGISKREALLSI